MIGNDDNDVRLFTFGAGYTLKRGIEAIQTIRKSTEEIPNHFGRNLCFFGKAFYVYLKN